LQGFNVSISKNQVIAVKGAQGVFAAWRPKVVNPELSFGLLFNGSHQLRQGDAV
jgi:hypothetical protein